MLLKLLRHAHSQAPDAEIEVEVERSGNELRLAYRLSGDPTALAIPPRDSSERRDKLWQHSCFEAFVRIEHEDGYFEFNFSPSTQWAAYAFDGYRTGMHDADVTPEIVLDFGVYFRLFSTLTLPPAFASAALRLGLSAIVEGKDGTKSWYALAHPPGAPDFHHADCFALELAPTEAP